MNAVYAGTSGFSYKAWKGPFYPEKLAEKEFLAYYGTRLNTVEINNTFYRMPRRDVLSTWRDSTPEAFRFVIKASRRITHFKRLKDADEPMTYLLQNIASLGDKTGAILFQLPPNLRCNLERLKSFTRLIPDGTPAVMEFRHDSWLDEKVFDVLRNRNIATCLVDDEDNPFNVGVRTSDWCYARLRKESYDKATLKPITDHLAKAQYQRSFVFFKHETEGAGPLMAMDFLKNVGRRKSMEVA